MAAPGQCQRALVAAARRAAPELAAAALEDIMELVVVDLDIFTHLLPIVHSL